MCASHSFQSISKSSQSGVNTVNAEIKVAKQAPLLSIFIMLCCTFLIRRATQTFKFQTEHSTFKADINSVYSDSQSQFLCSVFKAWVNSTAARQTQEIFLSTLLNKANKDLL